MSDKPNTDLHPQGMKLMSCILKNPIVRIAIVVVLLGFIVRILLLSNSNTECDFSFSEWIQIFLIGAVNDFCLAILASIFLWFDFLFIVECKYKKPIGYIIFSLFCALSIYVLFFNTIFHQYGSVVPLIAQILVLYKTLSFGLRLFIPAIRKVWSFSVFSAIVFIYIVSLLLFVGIGEYLFWDEFGVRYNFIAVDYLIYTNEVVGNIMESYPIIPLLGVLSILSCLISYWVIKDVKSALQTSLSFKQKATYTAVYLLCLCLAYFVLAFNVRFQNSDNKYSNELQANGIHRFCLAFLDSNLSYNEFYATLPTNEALSILKAIDTRQNEKNTLEIKDSLPEIRKNIVLITVESMSASFLSYFGNTEGITPNLDSLVHKSLFFSNLFATGNRTVRGLESVTLSRPPCAGESIVKHEENGGYYSLANVLKERDYAMQFFYGGDSYFDNMKSFFGKYDYEVIDRGAFAKDEVTFANIWGTCDEDILNKALTTFDSNAQKGKPFFAHIMTISNHRPYTYPSGKIDIPVDSKSRAGGVKYTDYALGKFLKEAEQKSWFKNTIFVIVADHCASSAGRTKTPLHNFHIPAWIYSPGYVKPAVDNRVVSQIDVMPTVFGLLHFSYTSQFWGKDVFSPNYRERAYVATYQNLGYLKNDTLTIVSPNRKIEQFAVARDENYKYVETPILQIDSTLLKETIATYQLSSKK